MKTVTSLIMAGGRGERLYPLTRDRAKPAVPFGGIYRIIDFTLSNCINSGMRHIYVLSQYKSLSLSRHIQLGWNILSGTLGEYVTVVPAQQRINEDWYKGTADAIFQNIYLLQKKTPDMALILSGDHIYKMDYRELIHFHMMKGADVTVAAVEMDRNLSNQLGVIEVDADFRIKGFQEKPDHPQTVPSKPDKILASMGVYVFNTEIMVKRLIEDAKRGTEHDFGKNVIPAMVASGDRAFAFSFVDERGETSYWRDVGTVEAYFEASMDLVSVCPLLNLYDASWPIHTYHAPSPPAKTILDEASEGGRRGAAYESLIAGGAIISGGEVRRSIISANVRVDSHARVEDSILLDGVRVKEGAKIRKAIVDKYSEIPEGMTIGYDLKEDMKNFTVTESGIVVVSKGFRLR
jgi:glucose-1-phosphate adenylyltransferase